ncbi:hypothetical protein N7486_007693 [Penicillium sp. IBT 16267x]|nr:hypothetical protein N7486_007693 [Penicillium sp. IBT 16267x]
MDQMASQENTDKSDDRQGVAGDEPTEDSRSVMLKLSPAILSEEMHPPVFAWVTNWDMQTMNDNKGDLTKR